MTTATVLAGLRHLHKALLILHSPIDQTVSVDNAADIFMAARHPKSFVSLDHADHLLSSERDAVFAANVISAWAERYLPADSIEEVAGPEHIVVAETGNGKFQNTVSASGHRLIADEPTHVGGMNSGPSPYDLLAAALGACTSMTLRMYAEHKKIDIGMVTVEVEHAKIHAADCVECTDEERAGGGRIDRFERRVSVSADIDEETRKKLVAIADRCPVHRTLEHGARIVTRYG